MRFLRSFFIPFFSLILLASCGPDNPSGKEGFGGRFYGGTLRLSETEKYQTLYPYAVTDVISGNICYQIYEGLLKFNPRNVSEVIPALCESWTIDPSGVVYTFKIKKGVVFHDDPCFSDGKGREITAEDFAWSFRMLCSQSPNNQQFAATFKDKVKGANDFYNASASGSPPAELTGVKVLDPFTLEITLVEPSNSFKYILAMPGTFLVAREAIEKYGPDAHIGTGPYMPVSPNPNNERLVMVKNPNYHGKDSLGNQLPFIDSVIVNFYPTKAKELDAFMQGNLDVVFGLPPESISEVVESSIKDFENPPKYELVRTPELETQYYEINTTKPPFNNVKVRQALNYAIDRKKIFDNVLKGEGFGPGFYGIVPPAFSGYDTAAVRGYSFNPALAKKLLAEAGFPEGKGFPIVKIELNSGGAKHSRVVEEVKNQLMEVLNINVEYEIVPMKQKLDDAKYGRADIFRTAWVADYPSPENFLWTLYGASVPSAPDMPSYPNTPRYVSMKYDSLFLAGVRNVDTKESYALFARAEQEMLKDAPVIILWYAENFKLNYFYVKNFSFNAIRQWSLSEVFFKKDPAADGTAKAPETEEKK